MKNVEIESFELGPIQTNSYVVCCDGKCWIIDVGGDPGCMIDLIAERQLELEMIIITHGHWDHIGGLSVLKKQFPDVPVAIHAADAPALTSADGNLSISFHGSAVEGPSEDRLLDDGQQLKLGQSTWQVLHCPGHTQGSVCLYCAGAAVALVGDVIFAGSVGRTDLPGGSHEQLLKSINEKLLVLPDDTKILPGHGPATTIGHEKISNSWL